jgi:hypothetical protein
MKKINNELRKGEEKELNKEKKEKRGQRKR